jgi:hypothetical protein
MRKLLLASAMFCVSLMAKDLSLEGKIIRTHDAAGGGFGVETKKGVYGLCYLWDNKNIVGQLESLEASGKTVSLSGNQTGRWSLRCESIVFGASETIKKTAQVEKQQQALAQQRQTGEAKVKAENLAKIQKLTGTYTNEDNPHELNDRYRFEVKANDDKSIFVSGYTKEAQRRGSTTQICEIKEPLLFSSSYGYFENKSPYDITKIINERTAEIRARDGLTDIQKAWDIKQMEKEVKRNYSNKVCDSEISFRSLDNSSEVELGRS